MQRAITKTWLNLNTKNYYSYIQSIIDLRGQWNNELRVRPEGCSRHHIIPKAFGGEPAKLSWNCHENIIWLTHYEHLIAHKFLAYDNPDNPIACSGYIFFRKFCENHNISVDTIENEDLFNHIYHVAQSRPKELNGMYNRNHSKESKILISKNHRNHDWTQEERIAQSKRSSASKWYTNGEKEIFTSQLPPEGYYLGRKPGTNIGGKNAMAIKCYVYNKNRQLVDICDCINQAGLKYGIKNREAKKHTGWSKGPYKGYFFIKESEVLNE